MTYEECIAQVKEGSLIDFKEYTLDRHERKHIALEVRAAVVYKVFPANTKISREVLEEIYGTELETEDYMQLSYMNCPRYVLSLGVNQDGEMDVKVISISKDFYSTGLQELSIVASSSVTSEPNYFLAQRNFI